jgi:5-methylthioadenosine/S-adenosylhomocysteine deaminase
MALVVAGTIAAMAHGGEDDVFSGRVWLADDGTVAAVTRGNAAGPSGFAAARTVDVGTAVIYPGLVDLHSHLGYNTLPLWSDPGQTTPYLHHDSWPGEPTYKPDLSWPALTLAAQAPETLLAYVQVRCLAGGTTSIQGWPATSRPASNRLVRCVDSDDVGPLADPVRVYTLTLKPEELGSRRAAMQAGSVFIYHCAEGRPGSIVTREFTDLDQQGCLQQRMVAVHTTALGAADYARWRTRARQVSTSTPYGTVVWSPFSNLWLYGVTTDVPAAREAGLTVCLGTDWGPSGTHNCWVRPRWLGCTPTRPGGT